MIIISRDQVAETLTSLKNGTIYSVTFVKKDGSVRMINSVKGTSKGVSGEGLKYDAKGRGLIPVFDLQLKGQGVDDNKCWRMVNTETVTKIVVNKEEITVQA